VSAWKRQAVESLSAFFDGMARPQAPESELFEQIGRLKMELEWLKKSTELDQRRELIGRKCKLSICKQCELLGVERSSNCANVGVAKSRGPA
jgi:putative transposase